MRTYGMRNLGKAPWLAVACATAVLVTGCSGSDTGESGTDDQGSPEATEVASPAGTEASACASDAPGVTGDSVKVAYLGDLTGPNTAVEVPFLEGIEAAIDTANSKGGLSGRTIELVSEDTQFDVDTSLAAYRKIMQDEPLLLMGLNGSSIIDALAPTISEDQIPVIGPAGTTNAALENDYFYNTQLDLPTQAAALSRYLAAETDASNVGSAVINVASGQEWLQLMETTLPESDLDFVGGETLDPGAVEASSQVQALLDADAEAVTVHSNIPLAVVVVQELEARGVELPVYSSYGAVTDSLWEATGEYGAERLFGITGFLPAYADVAGRDALMEAVETLDISEDTWKVASFVSGWVNGNVVVTALEDVGDDLCRDTLISRLESEEGFDTGGYAGTLTWADGNRLGNRQAFLLGWDDAEGRIEQIGDAIPVEE